MAAKRGAGSAGRAIHLLGPVEVVVGDRPLVVDTRKAIALIAYLAVTDRPASRETLAALLWPESDGSAARGALRRTLSVLAAGLGGNGLRIDRSSVALEGEWDVDLVRFREHLARVRSHAHRSGQTCAVCRANLEAAADLDRGDFMAGFALRDSDAFDDWQRAEAEGHRRALAGLFERLAVARAGAGDAGGAIEAARRWLDLDPLHEPAHRLLMRVLAESGEQAAAIRQYRACVRVLDVELGVAPLPETTELYESIRSGQFARERTTHERDAQTPPNGATPETAPAIPFVGRDAPLAELLGAYEAIGPDGRLLVVEGEPGIGKTRLLAAVADAVAIGGGSVLAASAYAGEAAIAFGPIAALVHAGLDRPEWAERLAGLRPDELASAARVVPRLQSGHSATAVVDGAPLDAIGRARAVEALAAVLIALVSGPRPGLVVVDDADWADASSTEVLAFVARRLRGRRVGLLLAWRPLGADDVDRRRMLADAERAGLAARVVLDRLSPADVRRLAREALGDPADEAFVGRLVAESEGLPLYIAEVLTAGPGVGAGTPAGVAELLRLRLAGLGDIARQVLAAASVVGRSFDFETVRAGSGRSEDETVSALEELAGRGVVVEIGTHGEDVRLDFTHALMRQVAYDSVGLVRRRLLHRRVADALRAARAIDELSRWSRIAHHETAAGRSPEAADAHRRAAARARAVFANREARDHLEAALALEPADAGPLHESLGEVLTLLGDYRGAIAHLEAAAAAPAAGREWAIERGLALVHARLGDWERAASHLSDAVDTAPDDPTVRSGLLADESAIRARLGDEAGSEAAGREALAVAEAAQDAPGMARATHVLGLLARARGALGEAAALLERALAATDDAGDPALRIASLNALALVRSAAGDRPGAVDLLEEALGLGERLGDRHRQAALENNLADVLRAEGRRDEAMDHLKRAVAIFADIGGRPGVPEAEIWKLVEW